MRLIILYRKNLKMTPGKLAAQAVHAATIIGHKDREMPVIVLSASDKKFDEKLVQLEQYMLHHAIVHDAGRTEVEPGTKTCVAYCDDKKEA